MIFKKLVYLFFVLFFILPCFGQKKREFEVIPMKELQNPKSPSYVPYPYPKNDQQVIADLEYHLRRYSNAVGYSTGKILLEAFQEDGRVRINRIIKVKTTTLSNFEYYHLIEFEWKETGCCFCRYIQADNGLFFESVEADIRSEKPFAPLIKNQEEILKPYKRIILSDEKARVDSNQEWIQLGSLEVPYLFIPSPGGNHYIDTYGNIYREIEVIKSPTQELKKTLSNEYLQKRNRGERLFFNEFENRIIHLTRIYESEDFIKVKKELSGGDK